MLKNTRLAIAALVAILSIGAATIAVAENSANCCATSQPCCQTQSPCCK